MDLPAPTGPLYASSSYILHPEPGPRVRLMRPHYTSCREGLPSSDPTASNFLPLTSIPTMCTPPPTELPMRSKHEGTQSPFLRLPTEIRLQIYSLLVLPRQPEHLVPSYQRINASGQDYYDYDKKQFGTDRLATASFARPTLMIRSIDGVKYPELYDAKATPPQHRRSRYTVRADRFRNRCMPTTYHCINVPRIEDQLGIIAANKQIHAEVAELLYSSYTFDFDTHVEAIYPFLRDLTPFSRSCIKNIRFVKRALPYDKEFDRAEWSSALRYLTTPSSGINLRRLELGIVAGRPGQNGWDRIATYSARDFELLKDVAGMEWMQYLMEFKGLQELGVGAVVEHCPPATNSMAMAGYIRFSASVETGFTDFIRSYLLPCAA